jgi:hypothetical protein
MNRWATYAFLLLALICEACNGADVQWMGAQDADDRKLQGLKGPVKSYSIAEYEYSGSDFDLDSLSLTIPIRQIELEFLPQGQLLSNTEYKGRQQVYKRIHHYNSRLQLSESQSFLQDDRTDFHRSVAYWPNGLKREEQVFNAQGLLTINHRYQYDGLWRLQEMQTFDFESDRAVPERVQRYFYEAETNRLKQVSQYKKGSLVLLSLYSNGQLRVDFKPETQHHTHYTYDAAGRCIGARTLSIWDTLIERQTYDYDADGRLLRQQTFDSAQRLRVWWQYRYDSLGNMLSLANAFANEDAAADTMLAAITQFRYSFDRFGNWQMKQATDQDGFKKLALRRLTYFQE